MQPISTTTRYAGPVANREASRDLKRILESLLSRDVLDTEIAGAVMKPASTFARRKNQADFPNFEELTRVGAHFNISARALQIVFGLRGEDEVSILTADERRQYEWMQRRPPAR